MEYHSGGSLPLLGRPRYCPGANAKGGYLCETGHCCGETGCCTYYYELWWFWLLWTVLILFSCCCAYRHRRAKLRVQQQQRQREISLLAYHGATSFPSSMLDLSFLASLKLPSYEEVAAQPSTPPPPYSSVFTSPRYQQPPRATDPHLLTQHDPLLHRPLSDGPSSLSSDNSSSCSCDSCCPSSPCSSSLSAPITYETDTSHASTPSEVTPLTLDVTMETIAVAAICLEASEARLLSVPPGAQEPPAKDSPLPGQTVTEAGDPGAAPPQPSPGTEPASVVPMQPDAAPPPSSVSGPPGPGGLRTSRTFEGLETFGLTRTPDSASVPCSPAPLSDKQLSLTTAPVPLAPEEKHHLVPAEGSKTPPEPVSLSQDHDAVHHDLSSVPMLLPVASDPQTLSPTPKPTFLHLPRGTEAAECPPGAGSVHVSPGSNPELVFQERSGPNPTPLSDVLTGSRPRSSPPCVVTPPLTCPAQDDGSASCPAITIESESVHAASPSPLLSPSPPHPPPPTLRAPALLLDPLTALQQSDKGGALSGPASSLSPSPRSTQSPPKQTVFSPCVDIFEPRSPCWDEGEGGLEGRDNDEDEDEDMEADESQYRHRRLTGDSGIEVCRCRVEDEEEEDEEEEDEKGVGSTGVHDSVDCLARSQLSPGEELCTPSAAIATPTPEDGGKVVIVMENV